MYKNGDIHDIKIRKLQKYSDNRGWLIELLRHDDMAEQFYPVMAYISETFPGVVRGPHEHADQADHFCFIGPSNFKVYLWDSRRNSPTYLNKMTLIAGVENPLSLIVPAGIVHAYKNIGQVNGLVFNAPNRLYAGWQKKEKVDEIRHEDMDESPFKID